MKRINYLKVIICCLTTLSVMNISSCKKDSFSSPLWASLTVTNAVIDGSSIRVGSIVVPVTNNNWEQLTVNAGSYDLYVWPVGDSSKPYYTNSKFNAEALGVYSVFLSGKHPNITGLVIKDNIPYHTDSTCSVRIINLVPNSMPLNITLSVTPAINEFSNLAYLQYTDFKLYSAKAANTSYVFQVRNSFDNSIIFNYTLPTPRFRNVTLVIRGNVNGNPGIGITRVNNDR